LLHDCKFLEVEQLIFTDARRYCRHRAAPRAARQIRNILCGAENVGRFPGHAIGQNDSVP
jgi:hypothetical protein